eukprot:3890083-Lingulodinium_polyedra.AAC.1
MGWTFASLLPHRFHHFLQLLLGFAEAGDQDPAELEHESPAEEGCEAEVRVPAPEDCQGAMHLLTRQSGPRHLLEKPEGPNKLSSGEPHVQQLPHLFAHWFLWWVPCLQLLQVGPQIAPGQ